MFVRVARFCLDGCLLVCDGLHLIMLFFFFSSRRRHTRFDCDWSSDVCSSDLVRVAQFTLLAKALRPLPLGKEDASGVKHGELTDPELRYRQRYADLAVHAEVQIGRASCRERV